MAGDQDTVSLVVAHLEADRARAARELHDEPLQTLCVSLLRMQVLQRSVTESQAADLARVIDAMREAIEQLQDLQTELYPTALDVLDVEALVREDIGRIFPDRAEPATGEWSPGPLDLTARLALLRLLREVLAAAADASASPRCIAASSATGGDATVTTLEVEFGPAEQDGTDPAGWSASLDRGYLDARASLAGGSIDVLDDGPGVRVRIAVAS